ncbi:MAG TPA: transposase [Candidatus Paceibacterota bacterium]|nr:transposase [Candidatus Paceibacterota bacterium]
MREKPTEDYIYHVYNRGVDKRNIFCCDEDRKRFLSSLYFFNDSQPVNNMGRLFELGHQDEDRRNKLVEILAFVLMPNHFHLLIKPLVEDGISEFMRKMGTGYTHYFNIKNERSGTLFQGKYKFVRIEDDEQLSYIPYYIHFNPIELIESGWKEKKIGNKERVLDFLKSYQWSSLGDYLGRNNFSEIINKDILVDYLGKPDKLEEEVANWLEEVSSGNYTNLCIE